MEGFLFSARLCAMRIVFVQHETNTNIVFQYLPSFLLAFSR